LPIFDDFSPQNSTNPDIQALQAAERAQSAEKTRDAAKKEAEVRHGQLVETHGKYMGNTPKPQILIDS
jgi:hypothetical protein